MIEPQLPNLEFNNQQMRDLIGKRVLVGITRRNMNDEVVSLEQFHGAIDRFSLDEGLVLKLTNGAERIIPPDLTRLETASPGEYRLKATGETVVDPDSPQCGPYTQRVIEASRMFNWSFEWDGCAASQLQR